MSALQKLKEHTAEPPDAAKARVWRALHAPARRPWVAWWPVPVAAALSVALVWVVAVRQATPDRSWRLADAVAFAPAGTQLRELGPGSFELERGALLASTWGEHLEVRAGGHRVESSAALFELRAERDAIELRVYEGEARIEGERVQAGHRWPSGLVSAEGAAAVRALQSPDATERREHRLATDAAAAGRLDEAVAWYDRLAARGSLRAEVALLERGELELRRLQDPARAVRTFDEAARRFPQGALAQERELSALDALVAAKSYAAARARAQGFLKAFPTSERRAEVEALEAACASYER